MRVTEMSAIRGFGRLKLALLLCCVAGVSANAQAPAAKAGIDDTWQGTLHAPGEDMRTVVKITKDSAGKLAGQLFSIDQPGRGIDLSAVTFQDSTLTYTIERLDLKYEGKMSADGKAIAGTQTQGDHGLPLLLERATAESMWTIPEPPKPVPQMPVDAKPVFEVATVKPSAPDEPGKLFGVRGGRVKTVNTTLVDLIKFAYDLQDKQIVDAPAWANTDKFDIDGQPDIAGTPNAKQLRGMMMKLLADRFQLKFHEDKRELTAYVLTVSKAGNKMKKVDSDPNSLGGLFFQGLGVLNVTNSDMDAFCGLMQAAVLDKPVVNHTDLQGHWDFRLKWTPDESQFGGMGVKVPPPTDAADAPPPLFTALQEQLGLKMEAGKAEVRVLVLEHAEKPSDN